MVLTQALYKFIKKNKINIIIFLFFFFITLIESFPLITNLKTSLYGSFWRFPGENYTFGEPAADIWRFWTYNKGLREQFRPFYRTPFLGAPIGVNVPPFNVLGFGITLFLTMIFGEIMAVNVFTLSSFIIAGFGMYLLVHYLTEDKVPSIFSGLIFAFSPYHIVQSLKHIYVAQIQWIPLTILYLLKFNDEQNYKNATLFSMFYCITVLTSIYNGIILSAFIGVYVILKIFNSLFKKANNPETSLLDRRLIPVLVYSAIFIILVLVFPFNYLSNLLTQGEIPIRSLNDLYDNSLKLFGLEYLIPPVYNPLVGQRIKQIMLAFNPSYHWEQILYVGYIPLILSVFYLVKRNGINKIKQNKFNLIYFILSLVTTYLLSLPPTIMIGEFELIMPSLFLYILVPSFRDIKRFSVGVIFIISILSGFGLSTLSAYFNSYKRNLIIMLFFTLIFVEFASIPPTHVVSVEDVPNQYTWLSQQQGNYSIIEYPLVTTVEQRMYEYMFWQRIHEKKLINGFASDSEGHFIVVNLNERSVGIDDITDYVSIESLSALGVKYLIVHSDYWTEYNISKFDEVNGTYLSLISRNDNAFLYEIIEEVHPLIGILENFYGVEIWSDGRSWWRMSQNGTLYLVNAKNSMLDAYFVFSIESSVVESEFQVFFNDKPMKYAIAYPHHKSRPQTYSIRLSIKPGVNKIFFFSKEPPNLDARGRFVSLVLSEFLIRPTIQLDDDFSDSVINMDLWEFESGLEGVLPIYTSTNGTVDISSPDTYFGLHSNELFSENSAFEARVKFSQSDYTYWGFSAPSTWDGAYFIVEDSNVVARTRVAGEINDVLVDVDRTVWHTYRIEWVSSGVSFYVDGKLVAQHTLENTNREFPIRFMTNKDSHIYLDLINYLPIYSLD